RGRLRRLARSRSQWQGAEEADSRPLLGGPEPAHLTPRTEEQRVAEEQNEELVVTTNGNVRVLRINRPEARNALNTAVISGLGRGLDEADEDPDVRAVIVTGTGDRAFCAGMDLRSFANEGQPGGGDPDASRGYARFLREGITKPVIGAANATAVAGGFELLLACDLVVASEEARFGIPEVKRGLFAAGGGVGLRRRLPPPMAPHLA